ncbi:MAG TPA: IS701 family transposase [Gemmataceae bacterium]|nr:IS701 family transposase [Gemmataceae bacterium]
MSLLEHPTAQTLLADADVSADDVRHCGQRLQRFLQRYLPRFYRQEQHELAQVVLQGKLSNLQRKTAEPIAYHAGRQRKPVQHFVGAGAWDDEAVMAELRRHVAEVLADPQAVMVLDPSGFPKKGNASCGVARQWCGRLGKVDNCQVGVFLAYVTAAGYAPLDRRLYLPREWAEDDQRRQAAHVPADVNFRESWRIGLQLLDRSSPGLPFGWVAADDELGRVTAFRTALRCREWRYVLDVPCNTLIRDLSEPPAAGRRRPPWRRVDEWAQAQPSSRWRRLVLGAGSKGPKVLRVLETWVQTRDEDGGVGPRERLVVIRSVAGEPQVWYTLSNTRADVPVQQIAVVHSRRHGIEEVLQAGKGEVGLGHYEVRSWVGWHHHMTLSLVALWFLILEKGRLGKKNPGVDGAADAGGVRAAAAGRAGEPAADRGGSKPGAAPQRRGADLPLVCGDGQVPAPQETTGRLKRLQ